MEHQDKPKHKGCFVRFTRQFNITSLGTRLQTVFGTVLGNWVQSSLGTVLHSLSGTFNKSCSYTKYLDLCHKNIYLLTNLSGNLSADLLWNLLRDSVTNLPMDGSALLNLDLLTDLVGDNPALSLRNLDLNQVTIRLRNKGTLFLDNLLGNFTFQGSGNVFTLLPGDVATDLLMNFLL